MPLDPEALTRLLLDGREPNDAFALRDRILALDQADGAVSLSLQEAETAASALRSRANELRFRARINPLDVSVMGTDTDSLRALAARLEADVQRNDLTHK